MPRRCKEEINDDWKESEEKKCIKIKKRNERRNGKKQGKRGKRIGRNRKPGMKWKMREKEGCARDRTAYNLRCLPLPIKNLLDSPRATHGTSRCYNLQYEDYRDVQLLGNGS